jgi:hypothetical protein
MVKAKKPSTTPPVPTVRKQRAASTASPSEKSLFMLRMKELDREFARQTKQLTALTKKFGKKLTEPITFNGKSSKKKQR